MFHGEGSLPNLQPLKCAFSRGMDIQGCKFPIEECGSHPAKSASLNARFKLKNEHPGLEIPHTTCQPPRNTLEKLCQTPQGVIESRPTAPRASPLQWAKDGIGYIVALESLPHGAVTLRDDFQESQLDKVILCYLDRVIPQQTEC